MASHSTIILTDVPSNIRHALTRWMIEPAPGVFIGTTSARVRDLLWDTIEQAVHAGWGLLIHPDNTEQGFTIRVCGTERRRITDLDGLQLVALPAEHLDNSNIPSSAD